MKYRLILSNNVNRFTQKSRPGRLGYGGSQIDFTHDVTDTSRFVAVGSVRAELTGTSPSVITDLPSEQSQQPLLSMAPNPSGSSGVPMPALVLR
jgi:hypothetical protein